jgi:hypothetical protein
MNNKAIVCTKKVKTVCVSFEKHGAVSVYFLAMFDRCEQARPQPRRRTTRHAADSTAPAAPWLFLSRL